LNKKLIKKVFKNDLNNSQLNKKLIKKVFKNDLNNSQLNKKLIKKVFMIVCLFDGVTPLVKTTDLSQVIEKLYHLMLYTSP
jgi:nickel-dependent lactate racemase